MDYLKNKIWERYAYIAFISLGMIYALLQGRLGNQLFIYAAAKRVQILRGRNEKIILCTKSLEESNISNSLTKLKLDKNVVFEKEFKTSMNLFQKVSFLYYVRKILKRTSSEVFKTEEKWQKLYNHLGLIICENGFIPYMVPESDNVYLIGYFQSEKYIAADTDYKIMWPTLSGEAARMEHIINSCNAVSIHIRRGDYLKQSNSKHCVCKKEYYENAVKVIKSHISEPYFFVFSDDIDFVKKSCLFNETVTYISEEFDDITNIYLMGCCKHYILSNSSFGWWGQRLNANKEKIVVAPDKWYKDETPSDLLQGDWNLINTCV